MSKYQYENLPANSIRLLTLSPGKNDDAIQCGLLIYDMINAPAYEALSYVWGNVANTQSITCNQKSLHITTNLDSGLRCLRHEFVARILWIDQICINQENTTERSQQVNIMGSIYRQAQLVVMWLGEDVNNEGPIACDFIGDIADREFLPFDQYSVASDELLGEAGLPGTTSPKWQSINHLMQLPYFERTWIIQEVRLAKSALVKWGDCEIEWELLSDFFWWAIFSSAPVSMLGSHTGLCSLIDQRALLRTPVLINNSNELKNLLESACLNKVTDDRDRIYALLGLTTLQSTLQADYSKSVHEVFRDAAALLIRSSCSLDILGEISGYQDDKPCPPGWATWVPRWHGNRKSCLLNSGCEFAASSNLIFSFPTTYGEHTSLDLVGFQCGKAKHVSCETSETPCSLGRIHCAVDWIKNVPEVRMAYVDESFIMSFLSTILCANHTWELGIGTRDWTHTIFLQFAKDWTDHLIEDQDTHKMPPEKMGDYLYLSVEALDAYISAHASLHDHSAMTHLYAYMLLRSQQIDGLEDENTEVTTNHSLLQLRASYEFINKFSLVGDKQFFITDENLMGMGPIGLHEGDIITILHGSKVPLVLRPCPSPDGNEYHLVGDCYVHGIMHGEAVSRLRERGELELRTRTFRLR